MIMKKVLTITAVVCMVSVLCSAALVSSFEYGSSYYSNDGCTGRLDFAVFDDHSEFFTQTGHNSPGSGSYIYAYQIFNDDNEMNKALKSFTLFDSGGQSLAGLLPDATALETTNGIQPGSVNGGQWVWTSEHGLVQRGDNSWLLVFTSNAGPTRGGFEVEPVENEDPYVPGEEPQVPEPTTIALLGVGGLILRKKRTKSA